MALEIVQQKENLILCQAEIPKNTNNRPNPNQTVVLGFLFFLLELRNSVFKNKLLHLHHSLLFY